MVLKLCSFCRSTITAGMLVVGSTLSSLTLITAVEAQAAGVPVIAFKAGGALDTVIDGKTGNFFKEQTKESLSKAVLNFNKNFVNRIRSEDCIKNAKRFSKERFKKEFLDLIQRKA